MQTLRFLVFMIALILASYTFANSQTVQVSQQYLDDSAKAFKEIVLLRDAVTKQEAAAAAKDSLIARMFEQMAEMSVAIRIRDEEIKKWTEIKCDTTTVKFIVVYRKKRCG